MEIEKIQIHTDDSITIVYSEILGTEGDKEVYTKTRLKTNRQLTQDVYNALANLKPAAIDMLELQESEIVRIKVKGIKFKHTKEKILGVVMSIERSMNNTDTPQKVDTPHYIAESYSGEGEEKNILNSDQIGAITLVKQKVAEFLKGAVDQMNLELDQENE